MSLYQNKVSIIGNLGRKPELGTTKNGRAFCNLNVATNESWTGANGEKQSHTEWHRVIVWDKQAEACAKYLNEGSQVAVDGKLQTRSWKDKKHEDITHYTTEIVAFSVTFGSSPKKAEKTVDSDVPPPTEDFIGSLKDDCPF